MIEKEPQQLKTFHFADIKTEKPTTNQPIIRERFFYSYLITYCTSSSSILTSSSVEVS